MFQKSKQTTSKRRTTALSEFGTRIIVREVMPRATEPTSASGQGTVGGWLRRLWGAEGVAVAAGLFQSVVVARVLGAEEFGVAALLLGVPAAILVFLDPQSEETVIRFVGESRAGSGLGRPRDFVRLAYRVDASLALVGLALVAALATVGAEGVGVPDQHRELLLAGGAAAALAAPISTARASLTATQEFGRVAATTAIGSLVRSTLAVVGAVGGGLEGFVIAVVVARIVELLLTASIAGAHMRSIDPGARARRLEIGGRGREVLRFMLVADLTTLVTVAVKHLDLVVLGWLAGTAEVGAYRLARSITAPVGAVLRPLQAVSYSRFVALASNGLRQELPREIWVSIKRISVPLVFVGSACLASAPFLLPVLVGPSFDAAVWPTVLLGVGSLISLAAFWVRPALLALGREATILAVGLMMSICTLSGYLLVAGRWGAAGIALVRLIFASAIGTVISAELIRRTTKSSSAVTPLS